VHKLADYIASQRITIEVNLTSNLQTLPHMKSVANHPLRKMLDHSLSVTICTDNRLVSNTTVTREIMLAVEHLPVAARSCAMWSSPASKAASSPAPTRPSAPTCARSSTATTGWSRRFSPEEYAVAELEPRAQVRIDRAPRRPHPATGKRTTHEPQPPFGPIHAGLPA
jgi:hypothetical protein